MILIFSVLPFSTMAVDDEGIYDEGDSGYGEIIPDFDFTIDSSNRLTNYSGTNSVVVIPNDIAIIGSSAFSGNKTITVLVIPNSVVTIESFAFTSCSNIKCVVLSKNVSAINSNAFNGCSGIQDVYYVGSEIDKNNIDLKSSGNSYLKSATWHYNSCEDTHVYTSECDTKCNTCDWVRTVSVEHDWADETCTSPMICKACGLEQGQALGHSYDDEYDAECNSCKEIRKVAEKVLIGDVLIDMMPDDELPVNTFIDTKFILGWKNPDGTKYQESTYVSGIMAEFVETKMMTVKYQLGMKENSIRYIASVDETERYSSVGWLFSLSNENPQIGDNDASARQSRKVYRNLFASGQNYSAKDIYGANYSNFLYLFELTGIPEDKQDTPIYVRPYVEMLDGTIVYGETACQSLNGIKSK